MFYSSNRVKNGDYDDGIDVVCMLFPICVATPVLSMAGSGGIQKAYIVYGSNNATSPASRFCCLYGQV